MHSETSERHKTTFKATFFVTTALANVRGYTYVRWKLVDAGQQCKPALAVLLTTRALSLLRASNLRAASNHLITYHRTTPVTARYLQLFGIQLRGGLRDCRT